MPYPVLVFMPSWDDPPLEGIVYVTSILVSNNETEQRRRLKTTPRRTIDLTIITDTPFLCTLVEEYVDIYQQTLIHVPLWWNAQRLAADISSGATALTVATTVGYDFHTGAAGVLLWESDVITRSPTVSSVGASTITTSTITRAFTAAKTWVVPTKLMRFVPLSDYERLAPAVRKFRFAFESPNTGMTALG